MWPPPWQEFSAIRPCNCKVTCNCDCLVEFLALQPLFFSFSLLSSFSDLFFCAFLPSFPRILWVPEREEPLFFFFWLFLAILQSGKGWRVRAQSLELCRWALPRFEWAVAVSVKAGANTSNCGNCKSADGRCDPTLHEQFVEHLRLRQEKRAQRLTFWVRRPPGGVGVFHSKGWWPKTSCPPSKVCLPWVSKRGIWDVPGILPGCPGPLGVFKKFVQKSFVRIFRSL